MYKHIQITGFSDEINPAIDEQFALLNELGISYFDPRGVDGTNISDLTDEQADVLVVAIGKAKFVTEDMVKDGAVVIDVGMNRDENGKLCGDVDFERVREKSSYITPVPGGVGPMTITMLMYNTFEAALEG